jgi:cyclomaltodextrin glucanotransferase
VLDYMVEAYLQWIDQGAAAFRIDTIRHMPHAFWKQFSDRIRAQHPGFFMFGEHFDYEASKIAEHLLPENGAISVLDFPGRQQMTRVFENPGSDFSDLESYLHLDDEVYRNPYVLMTFYDNHDVPRMDASPSGFIDAHNWLFTSRGIPVVYYGSEVAFMAGKGEHEGNRNFFGQARVDAASEHAVYHALRRIARVRQQSVALQRGLQVNIAFNGDEAAFYRVYQVDDMAQTALVLLNKGDTPAQITVSEGLSPGAWRDAVSGREHKVTAPAAGLTATVEAHGVQVLLLDAPVDNPWLEQRLEALMRRASD